VVEKSHRMSVSVTCIAYGKLEVLSGHADGTIIVWWATTGMIMLKVRVYVHYNVLLMC
jgi:hypothetical protein